MSGTARSHQKKGKRRNKVDEKKGGRSEGIIADRKHLPKRVCPHLAAEFAENGQTDLVDEMLRALLPRHRAVAQMAGRNLHRRRANV